MKKIFRNGNILTLVNDKEIKQAFLVEDGFIKAIGTNEEIDKLKDNETEVIDLNQRFVLPSFINQNASILALAQSLMFCDLNEVKSIDKLKNNLLSFISMHKLEKDEFVLGIGLSNDLYDNNEIDISFLDEINNDHSILLTNKEGTKAIINSKMLENLKQQEKLNDIKFNDKGKISGDDFIKIMPYIPNKTMDDILKSLNIAQSFFLSHGITTVQDNLYFMRELNVLTTAASNKSLKLDIVAHLDALEFKEIFNGIKDKLIGYSKGFRIGGIRINIDGLLETKTALISKPYLNDEELDNNSKCGIMLNDEKQIKKSIDWAIKEKTQIIIGANGDKALEFYLDYLQSKQIDELKTYFNKRPIINCSLINSKEIDRMKLLNTNVSIFSSHIWHFGDLHKMNIDDSIIKDLYPIKKLIEKGINVSCFQDSILVKPNMFEVLWCLTNRKTRGSISLGDEISVYDALKTITINPAYQLHEQERKGTIEVNKYADFIIVNENPLSIKKEYLSSIKIIETYKQGASVYKNNKFNN